MSARAERVGPAARRDAWVAAAVVGSASLLLVLRASLLPVARTRPLFVAMYLAILVAGVRAPLPAAVAAPSDVRNRLGVALVGVIAVVTAAIAVGAPPPVAATPWSASLLAVGAIGEEAVFRRVLFGWLERFGPVIAVVVTAVAFAALHVPVYGTSVLPVDLGAGLLLSWQRAATGSWGVPAATHAAANLMAVLR